MQPSLKRFIYFTGFEAEARSSRRKATVTCASPIFSNERSSQSTGQTETRKTCKNSFARSEEGPESEAWREQEDGRRERPSEALPSANP